MKDVAELGTKASKEVNKNKLFVGLMFFSVLITLCAIFIMSEWAEASGYGHATQHLLIFSGGVCAGVSVVRLRNKEGKQ